MLGSEEGNVRICSPDGDGVSFALSPLHRAACHACHINKVALHFYGGEDILYRVYSRAATDF